MRSFGREPVSVSGWKRNSRSTVKRSPIAPAAARKKRPRTRGFGILTRSRDWRVPRILYAGATPERSSPFGPCRHRLTSLRMIERFTGQAGRRVLITALLDQRLVGHDEKVAIALAQAGKLIELNGNTTDSKFIHENGAETDLYLILAGHVSIRIKGHEIATRMAGMHVGDMAIIDSSAPRSASVVAREKTVLLKIEEPAFRILLKNYPILWRRLAIELADRLRQRSNLIHEPNPQPVVFVGSSSESLDVARAVRANLKAPALTIRLWKDRGVFGPSLTTIEALAAAADGSDFAVLVLGADDFVTSRGTTKLAPRDNVILEIGWFMGAIGRERAYVMKPMKADLKLPTDLLGVIMLSYGSARNLRAATRDACKEISECIQRLHVK